MIRKEPLMNFEKSSLLGLTLVLNGWAVDDFLFSLN